MEPGRPARPDGGDQEDQRRLHRADRHQVEEVAVHENQFPSLIASAAVSGTMPDVISGLPLAYLRQLKQQKLLDTEAASQVVDEARGRPRSPPRRWS